MNTATATLITGMLLQGLLWSAFAADSTYPFNNLTCSHFDQHLVLVYGNNSSSVSFSFIINTSKLNCPLASYFKQDTIIAASPHEKRFLDSIYQIKV